MILDLSSLEKAIVSLEEAVHYSQHLPQNINADIVRDSVIQRFEYTYELGWKLLQRWIKVNVSPEDAEPRTKKDLFRMAAKKQMIADSQDWFEFTEARNNVAHTYNEKNAQYVYGVAIKFLPAVKMLYTELEKNNG
jgi:nucleotidyltransferase substrate binding protein (TIGR01987 family)